MHSEKAIPTTIGLKTHHSRLLPQTKTMKKYTSLFFLIFSIFILRPPAVMGSELLALIALKASLNDPLGSFRDWDFGAGVSPARWCSWAGLECDRRMSGIRKLDLSGRNLSGRIPGEIRHMKRLMHLNFSGNGFEGPLESGIFELRNLRSLDINHNFFSSGFSPGISKLRFLTFFNAYSNSFTGPLPEELIYLKNLEYLNLGGSYFEGEIPSSFGDFPNLKELYLHGNSLSGRIPAELGFLNQIRHMELGYNSYDGGLPAELSGLSNLVYLDTSNANLSGNLPPELGRLGKLETLLLFKNRFSGDIPASWVQMGSLQVLDLSDNCLTGGIFSGISSLKRLNTLSLMNNGLSGEIPEEIGEIPSLESLFLWNNSFSGKLSSKLGLNSMLQRLDVSSNSLSGEIPPELCRGQKLTKLILFSNQFSGEIPSSIANCTSLTRVRIQNNSLNGTIPVGFGSLQNLTYLELSDNKFSGQIPADLGNSPKLEFLNISYNFFHSELPENIWEAPNLQILSAGDSFLAGKIPDFVGCRNVYKIELDGNNLTGSVPWDIGHCEKLITLKLSGNSLTGIIPWEISAIPSITDVDLSRNLLTGTIPSSFNNCTTLENFNVSYNRLTGPVPVSGAVFSSLHPSSFAGNEGLCGGVLDNPCKTHDGLAVAEDRRRPMKSARSVVWITAAALGIALFVIIAGMKCFQANYSRRFSDADGQWKLTAFQRINFTAEELLESIAITDKVIGMGATGTVYKAALRDGEIIAVKKLWGKHKNAVVRCRHGVLSEVDVLGKIRHRNIVRLLGCCSNDQCTMLLYEYMPNGNLDDLLHGGDLAAADWVTRYKIAMGVAQGICYLHHDCDPPIVHRDLKPSNILLDGDMVARVADFGVAKLIQTDESMSMIAGSYGYIAPEYGYTLQVDEKSDIYSYGVVLLEILTGKRSVEAEFGDGNSLVDWVKLKMKTRNGIHELLDKNVGASCPSVREEMMLVLRIALLCTSRNPADRPSMRDVVSMMHEAKPCRKAADGGGRVAHGPSKGGLD